MGCPQCGYCPSCGRKNSFGINLAPTWNGQSYDVGTSWITSNSIPTNDQRRYTLNSEQSFMKEN